MSVNKIVDARKTMRDAFKRDPDFKRVYVDNVSMLLYDARIGLTRNHAKRNSVARDIIKLVFYSGA